MEELSNPSQKNSVYFPTREELKEWAEKLLAQNFPFLPLIDEVWVDDTLPCFEVTRIHPDCQQDLHAAAASVFYKVNKNHRRVDGNKRSSIICMYLLYLLNGWKLECTQQEIEEQALAIAATQGNSETMMLPKVKNFLFQHAVRLE